MVSSQHLAPQADLSALGPDCFCVFTSDAFALHVGANARSALGVAAAEISGGKFLERVHVQDRVGVAKAVGDCTASGTSSRVEFRLVQRTESAAVNWFEMRVVALADRQFGESPCALAIIRDMHHERSLRAEFDSMRERVNGISVAKGRFLANMSHELRTPLNAILGFSELLQSDVMKALPPERHQEYVGLIHTSARHLLQVVNDILDMSKMDAGKYEIVREPFDLATTLAECCAMMRAQAEQKGLALADSGIATLPEICADARAIKQVVINLLSNAVKFTPAGGRVAIAARRLGRSIEISVHDTGIGISTDHLVNLGTPFYQADSKYDRKYEGTGLGLSLVFGLVELHGGKVVIESERNRGTTVTIRLPIDGSRRHPVPAIEELHIVRAAPAGSRPMQATAVRGTGS